MNKIKKQRKNRKEKQKINKKEKRKEAKTGQPNEASECVARASHIAAGDIYDSS
jgi:hypothetical protein